MVNELNGLKVDDVLVRKVFREDLNMQYQKLKKIAFQGNSERCLV
jgi:hypothetical protein